MNDRPRRSIKPPFGLKEYIVAAELGEDDVADCSSQSDSKEKASFSCRTCSQKCKSRSELLHHLKKHRGKENFLCEDCGKSLSSFQAFTEHKNIHSNLKPHKCDVCGHSSRQLSVHLRHLLTHEKVPSQMFKCSICPKTFKKKEYLKQHTRKHVGDKPYECGNCNKTFSAKTELNRHLLCHSSLRAFHCKNCNKTFKMRHNLTAHIKAHTGKQSWSCSLCNTAFPQHSLLENHKKSHTKVIQRLELVKKDPRSLTVTSFPLDRRKVRHYQEVCLPRRLDLNDPQNAHNARVSLGLNDTLIPFSVIANSFGAGSYIKMKIVDQIGGASKGGRKNPAAIRGVTDALVVEGEAGLSEQGVKDEVPTNLPQNESKPQPSTNEVLVSMEESASSPLRSHCEAFGQAFLEGFLDEAKLDWLQTLVAMLKKQHLPLDQFVSQQLSRVQSKMQSIFHKLSQRCKWKEPSVDLHAPSCEFCFTGPEDDSGASLKQCKSDAVSDILDESPNTPTETCCPSRKLQLHETKTIQIDSREREMLNDVYNCYVQVSKALQKHFKVVLDIA